MRETRPPASTRTRSSVPPAVPARQTMCREDRGENSESSRTHPRSRGSRPIRRQSRIRSQSDGSSWARRCRKLAAVSTSSGRTPSGGQVGRVARLGLEAGDHDDPAAGVASDLALQRLVHGGSAERHEQQRDRRPAGQVLGLIVDQDRKEPLQSRLLPYQSPRSSSRKTAMNASIDDRRRAPLPSMKPSLEARCICDR